MVLRFSLWKSFLVYAAPFVLRPYFIPSRQSHGWPLTLTQNYDHPARCFAPSAPLASTDSMVLSRFLQRFNSVQLGKPELVSYKCKRENKASTQRGMLRQILFKKSTNIMLILSHFTALNIHPVKSVCKESLKRLFFIAQAERLSEISTSPPLICWELFKR